MMGGATRSSNSSDGASFPNAMRETTHIKIEIKKLVPSQPTVAL
jgi:hypothetical protein